MRNPVDIRRQIVGCLQGGGEMPAWAIITHTGIGVGTFYATMEGLEADGTITSRWKDGPSPRRRLYRIADSLKAER